MQYKVVETFYSIQGEGDWVGTPAFFIRLAGCNLNCKWCDTNYSTPIRMASVEDLVEEALGYPARKVVVTGGEPLLQDTQPLVVALRKEGFKTHLETNGTLKTHLDWDWITVSPKSPVEELDDFTLQVCSEVKFIAGFRPDWRYYIKQVCDQFNLLKNKDRQLFVMPLAKAWPSTEVLQDQVKQAYEFVLSNPRFRLCLQMHKYVGCK